MNTPLASMESAFKALGDETRLRILGLLLSGEVCVCHIHESLRIPQSKASRHLAYLRRAGLVETRRQGVWIYYRLAGSRDPVRRALLSALGRVEAVRRDVDRLRKTCGC
jgi:ArsR family transcriptional regulator, arsenate/arsenite/antimonite-responsive transcriptional repressor